EGPLPPARAVRYLAGLARALAAAHALGIVHRDLKPSNVMIDSADQPRVLDFGLAKRRRPAPPAPEHDFPEVLPVLDSPARPGSTPRPAPWPPPWGGAGGRRGTAPASPASPSWRRWPWSSFRWFSRCWPAAPRPTPAPSKGWCGRSCRSPARCTTPPGSSTG